MSESNKPENPLILVDSLGYLSTKYLIVNPPADKPDETYTLLVSQDDLNSDSKAYAVSTKGGYEMDNGRNLQIIGKNEVNSGDTEIHGFGKKGAVEQVVIAVSNGSWEGYDQYKIHLALKKEYRAEISLSKKVSFGLKADPIQATITIHNEDGSPVNGTFRIGMANTLGYFRSLTDNETQWHQGSGGAYENYHVSNGQIVMEYKASPIKRNWGENQCGSQICDALSNYFVVEQADGKFIGPKKTPIYTSWVGSVSASPNPILAVARGGSYWTSVTVKDVEGKPVPDGTVLVVDGPAYWGSVYREDGEHADYVSTHGGQFRLRYQAVENPHCWPATQVGTTIYIDDTKYAENWPDGKITVAYPPPCL